MSPNYIVVHYRLNNPCIKEKYIKKNTKPIINTIYMHNSCKRFKNYIHA